MIVKPFGTHGVILDPSVTFLANVVSMKNKSGFSINVFSAFLLRFEPKEEIESALVRVLFTSRNLSEFYDRLRLVNKNHRNNFHGVTLSSF